MASTRKVLGQLATAATTETDLYEVPALTSTVISSIAVCNRGSVSALFRVSISVGGGVTANKDYVYYDLVIPPNDTFIATVGLTLGAGDKVRVYSTTGNLSWSLFGEEVA